GSTFFPYTTLFRSEEVFCGRMKDMKLGFIGTGNMGSVLIQAFCESSDVVPAQLVITNRTRQKAERLKRDYPDLHVAADAHEVVSEADMIFICVKPLDIHPLIESISAGLRREQLLISITSPVTVEELE